MPTQVTYSGQYFGNFHRLDYAQMYVVPPAAPALVLNPATSTGSFYQGAQAGDPCVNELLADWQTYPAVTYAGTLTPPYRNVWQPTGAPALPPNVAAGAAFSPTRNMWRDRAGNRFDLRGNAVR